MNNNYQHLVETQISSAQIFTGNFMKVMRDVVELPNGKFSEREYIKHSGAVAVIALDNENNIIMEKQYRHPVKQVMIELPAGKIDSNEDVLECGKRELLEETGYIADNWTYLGEILPCIGYSTERIHFYLAENITFTKAKLDDGEFLDVYKQPLQDVINEAYSGKITDAKTLSGLMLLIGHINKGS